MRPQNMLGSEWVDRHGNRYRVYATSRQADGDLSLGLRYIPPTNKTMLLSDLEENHRPVKDGSPMPSLALPSNDQPKEDR
jgi:hypothetical protein